MGEPPRMPTANCQQWVKRPTTIPPYTPVLATSPRRRNLLQASLPMYTVRHRTVPRHRLAPSTTMTTILSTVASFWPMFGSAQVYCAPPLFPKGPTHPHSLRGSHVRWAKKKQLIQRTRSSSVCVCTCHPGRNAAYAVRHVVDNLAEPVGHLTPTETTKKIKPWTMYIPATQNPAA